MEQFLVILTLGIYNGFIVALVAIGYTLVYGIIELINFAHGDVFMIGTLATFFGLTAILPALGVQPSLVGAFALLPFVMLLTATLNASIERVAYRPLRNAPRVAPLISAIGMSFILQNVGIVLLGPSPKAVPQVLPTTPLVQLPGGQSILRVDQLIVTPVTIPLLLALAYFV
ncbi:MAG TPA: hypothetical protein VNJ28_06900, partial [Candidatus Limnocylindrales bacterium]|nr:hypothetical protein [Candidatus Limnocylindrales bacterium]